MKGNYSKRFEHDKKQKNVHNHYTNHLKKTISANCLVTFMLTCSLWSVDVLARGAASRGGAGSRVQNR